MFNRRLMLLSVMGVGFDNTFTVSRKSIVASVVPRRCERVYNQKQPPEVFCKKRCS